MRMSEILRWSQSAVCVFSAIMDDPMASVTDDNTIIHRTEESILTILNPTALVRYDMVSMYISISNLMKGFAANSAPVPLP